jgi:hypothetical protein
MRQLLQEACEVMQKVSKQSNWWRNIKNMLPGSELQQIKDINQKIERSIQLINLSLTAQQMKKRTYKQLIEEEDEEDSQASSVQN